MENKLTERQKTRKRRFLKNYSRITNIVSIVVLIVLFFSLFPDYGFFPAFFASLAVSFLCFITMSSVYIPKDGQGSVPEDF